MLVNPCISKIKVPALFDPAVAVRGNPTDPEVP